MDTTNATTTVEATTTSQATTTVEATTTSEATTTTDIPVSKQDAEKDNSKEGRESVEAPTTNPLRGFNPADKMVYTDEAAAAINSTRHENAKVLGGSDLKKYEPTVEAETV